jgi:hypothetical protein
MSLGHVISRFRTATYTITRAGAGTYTDGRFVPAATSTITIEGSVQPAGARQLELLPEGQRAGDLYTLYTTTELFTRGPGSTPDIVTLEGTAWVVIRVDRWDGLHAVNPHYECIISKQVNP